MSTTPLLVVAAIPCIFSLAKYWWSLSAPLPGIPHNKRSKWNPFGDIPALVKASTPVDFFSQHVETHGKISQILLGPLGRLVLVADAKEIEENLLKHSQNFDKAEAVRAAFSGTMPEGSVGLPANEQWKLHRRMMAPSMSPAYLATKTNRIFANAQKLIDIWSLKSRISSEFNNGVFECDDDIERFAMDTIIDVLFGENFHCLESTQDYLLNLVPDLIKDKPLKINPPLSEPYRSFRHLLKNMGKALRSGAARLVYFRLKLSPSWLSARRQSHRFVAGKLQEHLQEREKGTKTGREEAFLERLSARYHSSGGRPEDVSPSAFRDELVTYIIGGADTSATVIGWIIKYLTLHPRVQCRLHAELSASFDNFSVSFEELQGPGFPYLDAVIHETLRLANVGGVSARDALQDVTISGHLIPKGSQVFFLTGHSAINDAPPVKGNSEITSGTFYPERWLSKGPGGKEFFDSSSITSWPFGYGPRGCPGQRLAILELKAFLLAFSLSFFLEDTYEATDSTAEMLVVLRKPAHMWVQVRKWKDDEMGA
ncbi:cytochrome P450 [Mycena capillaripes]|nr:cytochrome P450 [Mycena capillaripes]